jgi:hypothetical protein
MRQEITRAHKGWALDVVQLFNEMTKMNKEDVSRFLFSSFKATDPIVLTQAIIRSYFGEGMGIFCLNRS